LAVLPGPLALLGIVVLRPVHPGIIADLMVIPGEDPGDGGVRRLQVRVGPVLTIACAVVVKRDDLVLGLVGAAVGLALLPAPALRAAIPVDVVADVHGEIHVAATGEVSVGVEAAEGIVRAGKHRELDLLELADRQGPCTAYGGSGRAGEEAVVVD